ncbi:hypothetical protein VTJ04DRAFT_10679 [Mycothermus thermophilus]|uniref:uncharacterized protein n=1 Tax=Humicola insolens TaxID=85995 RepID=UPI0037448069
MSAPSLTRPALRPILLRPLRPSAARRISTLRDHHRSLSTTTITTTTGPASFQQQPLFTQRTAATTTSINSSSRNYHSTTHPPPPPPFTEAETTLLTAAYKHVPQHGFTPESLALGARDAGLLDISPAILPDGEFALIRWHLYTQREGLKEKLPEVERWVTKQGQDAVEEKVEGLMWMRLMGNEGVVGRWQEALAIMALPSHIPTSLHELALLSDEILYLAGDVSVDPSWYTKRASLSAIYAAAELFQTADTSPQFRETRAFLRRRLAEAKQARYVARSVGEWVGFTAGSVVNILRSKGVRI